MRKSGFTLIELSIVLVIIGLITGGVLVGRDLIHAAEIRATVKQVETFDASVNTFKGKYNCMPGDCAQAGNFGFTAYDGDPAHVSGNGDGLIGYEQTPDVTFYTMAYEIFDAMHQLEEAHYVTTVHTPGGVLGVPTVPVRLSNAPGDADGRGGWYMIYSASDDTYAPFSITGSIAAHYLWLTAFYDSEQYGTLLPEDAFAIDNKLDDGLPRTGIVLATFGGSQHEINKSNVIAVRRGEGDASLDPDVCIDNAVTEVYNVQNATGAGFSRCTIVVRASF